jgi:HAD superfamily hydrolase (TIGR01509 family)
MVEYVIFDVDGTLVDSVDLHARAWQEALAHFGFEVSFEEIRFQIGKGADQLIPVFVRSELERLYGPIDELRSKRFKEKYLRYVKGFPRTRELVQRLLSDGKRVALASSARGDELEHYKRVAGISDLVDTETSADDADKSKPHPDIFEATLSRLGNPPPNLCVVVGDTPYDVIAARQAHVRTVGLLCGGFPEGWLWRAGAVAVYRDPAALLEVYQRAGNTAFEGGIAQLTEDAAPA